MRYLLAGPNEKRAALYHASATQGIRELEPRPSVVVDNEPQVFATPSRGFALSFLGKWNDDDFDLGREGNGPLRLRELRPGALQETFGGVSGSLYHLADEGFSTDPRAMAVERVKDTSTPIQREEKIRDALEALKASDLQLEYYTPSETKEAATYSAAEDIKLWKKWKQTQSPADLGVLLKRTEGVRRNALHSWKTTVSPVTMNSEAIKLSVDAFAKYDPNRGVKLSTHLTNHLQKLSRTVYEESSFLSIPENRTLKNTTYTQAQEDMRERLGRDPSSDELSDELGWPVREVERFQKESRQLLVASEPVPIGMEGFCPDQGTDPNHRLHYALADMQPVDQEIFRLATGYGGNPVTPNPGIMKKLNIKQSQLSYRKRVIANKLGKIMPGHQTVQMLGCT